MQMLGFGIPVKGFMHRTGKSFCPDFGDSLVLSFMASKL